MVLDQSLFPKVHRGACFCFPIPLTRIVIQCIFFLFVVNCYDSKACCPSTTDQVFLGMAASFVPPIRGIVALIEDVEATGYCTSLRAT